MTGIWIHNMAAAIVAWNLTESALIVGAVTVFQFAPQIAFAPAFGAIADRIDRRIQLLSGRLISATGSIGLAIALWHGKWDPSVAVAIVLGAALVVGVGFAISGPALMAIVPSLVTERELPTAVALSSVPISLARAAGPAIGAVIVITWGAPWAFAVAGISHAAFSAVLARLQSPQWSSPPDADLRVRAGLLHVVRDRRALLLLLSGVAISFGADPSITLTPPLAHQYGAGPEAVGLMSSAFGAGTAAGFFVFLVLQRRAGTTTATTSGLALIALGAGLLVPAGTVAWASAWFVIGGIGMAAAVSGTTTQLHQSVPEELRGRIMGLWNVAYLGSRPVAAAANGYVTDAHSTAAALTIVAIIVVAAALATAPRPKLRQTS